MGQAGRFGTRCPPFRCLTVAFTITEPLGETENSEGIFFGNLRSASVPSSSAAKSFVFYRPMKTPSKLRKTAKALDFNDMIEGVTHQYIYKTIKNRGVGEGVQRPISPPLAVLRTSKNQSESKPKLGSSFASTNQSSRENSWATQSP